MKTKAEEILTKLGEWKFGGERAFNEIKRAASSLFGVDSMELVEKPGTGPDFIINAPLSQDQWNEIFGKIDLKRYTTKLSGSTMEFYFGMRQDDSGADQADGV